MLCSDLANIQAKCPDASSTPVFLFFFFNFFTMILPDSLWLRSNRYIFLLDQIGKYLFWQYISEHLIQKVLKTYNK